MLCPVHYFQHEDLVWLLHEPLMQSLKVLLGEGSVDLSRDLQALSWLQLKEYEKTVDLNLHPGALNSKTATIRRQRRSSYGLLCKDPQCSFGPSP